MRPRIPSVIRGLLVFQVCSGVAGTVKGRFQRPPLSRLHGVRGLACHSAANRMLELLGSKDDVDAARLCVLIKHFCQVFPPICVRKIPRSSLSAKGMSELGDKGDGQDFWDSLRGRPMACVSARPAEFPCLARVDRLVDPVPPTMLPRMQASPVPHK